MGEEAGRSSTFGEEDIAYANTQAQRVLQICIKTSPLVWMEPGYSSSHEVYLTIFHLSFLLGMW